MRLIALLVLLLAFLGITACGGSGGGDADGGGEEFSAVFVVTNLNDAGPGSLRQMLADAPEDAAIVFDTALPTGTITLQSTLHVDRGVTIGGLSSTLGRFRIDGDHAHRIFEVSPAADKFELRDLILADSVATSGSAIRGSFPQLVLRRVQFVGCASTMGNGSGGAIHFWEGDLLAVDCAFTACSGRRGGALYLLLATARLERCSFYLNQATDLQGGAIHSASSELTAVNCSFLDNQALDGVDGAGGAVYAASLVGTLTARFYACTLVGNDAGVGGGGIHAHSSAGAHLDLEMHATIAAANTGSGTPDVHMSGPPTTAHGSNNVLGIGNVGDLFDGLNGNQGGDFITPLSPALGLVVFDARGRAFRTPAGVSPARDHIAPGDLLSDVGEITIDQGGQARNVNGMSDVGAIEAP